MSERSNHTFQFSAGEIAQAAQTEAAYHEDRVGHWADRREAALARVKDTIGAEVVEQEVTGGKRAGVVVKYGDPAAWEEYQLACGKVETHRLAAERYRTDQRVYGTQGDRSYDLDTDDVHHFRLGDQGREA